MATSAAPTAFRRGHNSSRRGRRQRAKGDRVAGTLRFSRPEDVPECVSQPEAKTRS